MSSIKELECREKRLFHGISPLQHWVPVEATFANLHLKYNILLPSNTTNHCNDAELFVFIAIRLHSFDKRQIIRSTWANPENIGKKTVVKFAIGHLNDELTMQQLFEEHETFNDLILYDHPDEYRQLYIKIHAAFNWQQKVCPNVKYIFRADDDIVVDLPRLRYWINKEMSVTQKDAPAVLFGKIRRKDKNIFRSPNHKWYISEKDYPRKVFPPLAFGWATLYSNKAIKEMLQHAHEVNSFAVEDVFYSGVLAEKAAVRKIDFSKHFQVNYGRGILVECDKEKVPLVTVACCFYSHSSIVKAYERLKSIQCPRRNADLFYSLYIKL